MFFASAIVSISSSLAAATTDVLNYSGQLVVGTTSFDGVASFKFALVSSDGSKTYWSNDGTSAAGSEPIRSVPVRVVKGTYLIAIGDPKLSNMQVLPLTLHLQSDLRLRLWANVESGQFQRLVPDQRIRLWGNQLVRGPVQHIRITKEETRRVNKSGEFGATKSSKDFSNAVERPPAVGYSPLGHHLFRSGSFGSSGVGGGRYSSEAPSDIYPKDETPVGGSFTYSGALPEATPVPEAGEHPETVPPSVAITPPIVTGQVASSPSPDSQIVAGAPMRPASSDQSAPSTVAEETLVKNPHVDCDVSEPVRPGKTIRVTIYADDTARHNREDHYSPVKILSPSSTTEFPVVVYLLLSHQFKLIGTSDSKVLVLHRREQEPNKLEFKLKVERGAEGTGYVTALFFYQGYPCGRVRRSIQIGYPDETGSHQSTTAAGTLDAAPTLSTSLVLSSKGPDMTIVVVKTDSSRFQYFVLAPQSQNPNGPVFDWDHYSDPTPKEFVESFYSRFGSDFEKNQTRASLFDLGRQLFDKAPSVVGDVLRELIDKNEQPKTTLVFSDEPYFPWELMIPHWSDKDPPDALPLGVTSAVARWTAGSNEAFRSPARQIAIGKSVFWAPGYETDKLESSETEQHFIQDNMRGTAISPATFNGICQALAGSDATVLHFICHGAADGQQTGQQIILAAQEESEAPASGEGPAGETPPKKYYHSSITAGELGQCDGVKSFCSRRPLIFLNACQVGRTIQTMTGVGGFGPVFIQLNAGGVVAPLWSVFDRTAERSARKFYTAVRDEPLVPFAETLRRIREQAYKGEPSEGMSTYAAYCFYGDPLATPTMVTNQPSNPP